MSNSAFTGIECRSCGTRFDVDLSTFPCPECGGFLDAIYDLSNLDLDKSTLEGRGKSMWKYRELLPITDSSAVVSLGEGLTPIVEASKLADKYGIGTLLVKDEGQNPTSTFKDRGASVTMSGLRERGIEETCIVSVGNAGHAAATYAGRADITCHVYLTSDRGGLATTLMQAHGAELHLGEDFVSSKAQMNADSAERGWTSLGPFLSPFRHEGKKTMGLELFEQLEWSPPDHIVYPTGGGVGIVGIWKAFEHYRELGWLDDETIPSIHVAQTEGCAPLVRAIDNGEPRHRRWENPESIARGVMNPDPGASEWILENVYESGGTGVAVSDRQAVDAAIEIMRTEGVEMGITSAVALAGTIELSDRDVFGEEDSVVIVNTGAATKSASELAQFLPDLE